ncbi:MAG: hydrogenase maturation nickel metallochaperone HypA [Desulfobacteraceae bacterium]|jgi:hydrogenase nickel incorporation protein HypA/HybF
MHEQSIVASLLALALEDAKKDNAQRIIGIKLVIGELTGVEKDAVNFYFGFMAKGTVAEGASLEFKYIKPQLRCRDCDIIFPRSGLEFNCPKCNKKAIEIIGGRELYIDSMEII